MTKERLFAFTDAILAIIMTILVLELPKPAELTWIGVWDIKASFLSFGISFFGLAVMWADWHREWHDVKEISDKMVWGALFVLFFMAFVPYFTGLLASDFQNSVAQILYGVDIMLITLFNSVSYRSLAAIEKNSECRKALIARANLLFINSAVLLLSVILSLFVVPYCAIIGIVIASISFVLPIFKK